MSTNASASIYVPIVPDDDVDLPNGVCRGINCGTAGTVNLHQPDGTLREDYPLQKGYNPIQALRVLTGGSADDMWALYGG